MGGKETLVSRLTKRELRKIVGKTITIEEGKLNKKPRAFLEPIVMRLSIKQIKELNK